jgi:predicted molibdopterin-dependent oxidoreductase YjgC
MQMLSLKVDGDLLEVAEGTTVLDACRQQGIDVPTMCYLDGHTHFSSCMVCVVKDVKRGMLIPACSAPVTEGMAIETATGEVVEARRVALELLLSEHVGDCEGPCRRVCPAQINIPVVIRKLIAGDREAAAAAYRSSQTQEGIPCLECNARCEKPCRRNQVDDAVSIRRLMLYALGNASADAPAAMHAKRFNSVIGKLTDDERQSVLALVSDVARVEPADAEAGYTEEEATCEASRCLHCDCRKPQGCQLRVYAEQYGCKQSRYKASERVALEVMSQHPSVVYEPGKCIKCGICVKLTEQSDEPLGMAFLKRGYDCVVGVPFSEPLEKGMTSSADECIRSCPTGALAYCDGEDAESCGA